jgi:hypothetical protein
MTEKVSQTGLRGWCLVDSELRKNPPLLTSIDIGSQSLLLINKDRCRVFEGICPHRGAHLGFGGKLIDEYILCAFHGRKVYLGQGPLDELMVREISAISVARLTFCNFGAQDLGFPRVLRRLGKHCTLIPALEERVKLPGEFVIENGFDVDHFAPVHGVEARDISITQLDSGVLRCRGVLTDLSMISSAGANPIKRAYRIYAFSPYLSVIYMGGDHPYFMIAAATPTDQGCIYRLTLALPKTVFGEPPARSVVDRLILYTKTGFLRDHQIWQHISVSKLTEVGVPLFQQFCRRFSKPFGASHARENNVRNKKQPK